MKAIKPILSVVFQKAEKDLSHFDYQIGRWIEKGPPIPVNKYIGAGGHQTSDLQKAQVFGFSKHAKDRLKCYYSDSRLYEIRAILLQEV